MDFDKKDGLSYLDNVPFKISSAFLPPPPIIVPSVFNAENGLSFEEYDFSKEKEVLEDIKKRTHESSAVNNSKSNHTHGLDSSTKSNLKNIFPLQSDILLPKLQKNLNKVSNADKTNHSKINLSDFENDTSSPFDYMELQTINDFEELSNVFQGLNNKYNSDDNVYKERNSDCDNALGDNNVGHYVSKSMSFPLENTDSFEKSEKCPNKDDSATGTTTKENFDPVPRDTDTIALNGRRQSVGWTSTLTMPKVPCLSSSSIENNNVETHFPDLVCKSGSLRGSKSYSDIHRLTKQNSEDVPKQERSLTPPSTMLMAKGLKSTDSPVHELNETTSSDLNCDNSSNASSLPDPYYELADEDKKIVDAIVDMGFSRAQVSRSVKHLGNDEKMVVEHLCQIQVLEECGYDCLEAEAALHLHDYNQDQAKNFLDLINKFQDLGFEKNAVKKALIQNKNDWSKTIDALLS